MDENTTSSGSENGSNLTNESVGSVTEQAIKKLDEMKKANKEPYAQIIIDHIRKRVAESESLGNDVIQAHKTWERCWGYIYKKASKAPRKGQCAAIKDETVFEWAEDYFIRDDKEEAEAEEKKKAEKKKVLEAKPKAKKSSKKDTKKKDAAPEPEEVTDEITEPEEAADQPKAEEPAEEVVLKEVKAPDRDAPAKKEAKKKPKKEKGIEGQMSLFDMFG